jgi:hypothetical protein
MIVNAKGIRTTMEQMDRMIRALDDLRTSVLARDPKLFAVMAEGPLEDLDRLRGELNGYIDELEPPT